MAEEEFVVVESRIALFPTFSEVVPVTRTRYSYRDLKDLYGRANIYPFILYLENEKIYVDRLKWIHKMTANANRCVKDAGKHDIKDEKVSWTTVARILSRESGSDVNCDRRMSYVFNDNYFIVKTAFTFGLRTVPEGTVHLYQVTNRRLHFYFMPRDGRVRFRTNSRLLAVDEVRRYNRFVLESNKAYRVKAGTSYVIVATQKAFFSLHVLPESAEIPFRTVDPVQAFRASQRERRCTYNRPPPTPNMLEHRQEEEEFRVPQQPLPPPDQPEPQEPQNPEQQNPEPQNPQNPEPQYPEQQNPEQQPKIEMRFYYPLEKEIRLVHPDMLRWYRSLKQTFGPIDTFCVKSLEDAGGFQTEPLDLTFKREDEELNTIMDVNELEISQLLKFLDEV